MDKTEVYGDEKIHLLEDFFKKERFMHILIDFDNMFINLDNN